MKGFLGDFLPYLAEEDAKLTKKIVAGMTRILETDPNTLSLHESWALEGFLPDSITAEFFETPSAFSTVGKLEYQNAKQEFWDYLRLGPLVRVVDPIFAGSEDYEWDDRRLLASMIADLNTLREALLKRTDLRLRRKRNATKCAVPSFKKRRAGKLNGLRSGEVRSLQAYELMFEIRDYALGMLDGGLKPHKLASNLARLYLLSERQIRRYLSKMEFYTIPRKYGTHNYWNCRIIYGNKARKK